MRPVCLASARDVCYLTLRARAVDAGPVFPNRVYYGAASEARIRDPEAVLRSPVPVKGSLETTPEKITHAPGGRAKTR